MNVICTFDLVQHQVVNRITVISSSLVQSLVCFAKRFSHTTGVLHMVIFKHKWTWANKKKKLEFEIKSFFTYTWYSYYIKGSKSVKTNWYLSLVSVSRLFEDKPRDSDFIQRISQKTWKWLLDT